jgi:hypothetical protein
VSTLVVTTKQEECGGIPDLERPQIEHTLRLDQIDGNAFDGSNAAYLNAEVTSVNVVSQEEIPCGGGVAADLEEFHQVVLAMDKFRMYALGEH